MNQHATFDYLQLITPFILGFGAIILSIITIIITNRNTEKQFKIQLATTIEKEWTHDVRSYILDFIEKAAIYSAYRQNDLKATITESELYDMHVAHFQMFKNMSALTIFLDGNKKFEEAVLESIKKLNERLITAIHENDLIDIQNDFAAVLSAAHILFDSKKPKIE